MEIISSVLNSFFLLSAGITILSVINFFIQKKRAKTYFEKGYFSSTDTGISIKKDVDGKIIITSEEKPAVIF